MCACGSGLARRELRDARGIFCTFVCDRCERVKSGAFRPSVLCNPNDIADEAIDEDEL